MDYEEYVAYESILAKRATAAVLDYVLYLGLVLGYAYVFGTQNKEGIMEVNGWGHISGLFLLWVIYFPLLESILGYTLFKGLLDLKVVRERREDSPFIVCFKRHILDFFDFILFGVVAIVLAKVTNEHKRLGDMWAHTRVVLDMQK